MYGLNNISPSLSQILTPSAPLGTPGDMYIITDTRQRPRKDLTETKAFQRFDIRTLNAEELAKMQANDPLLYEQIKADMSTSDNVHTEPTATASNNTSYIPEYSDDLDVEHLALMYANIKNSYVPGYDEPPLSTDSKTKKIIDGNLTPDYWDFVRNQRMDWNLIPSGWNLKYSGNKNLLHNAIVTNNVIQDGYLPLGIIETAFGDYDRDIRHLQYEIDQIKNNITDESTEKQMQNALKRIDKICNKAKVFQQKFVAGDYFKTNGLGKPTIKLEFETNSELADFLKGKKNASQYAASDITDSYTFENGFIVPKKKKSKKDNKAITANNISQLPPSDGSKQLPPSDGPKQLPPSNTANLPKLQSVLKPDGVFLDKRKIGDYGYINDKLKYVDLFINRDYAVHGGILYFAEKIFPGAVIIICYERDGKWNFAIKKGKFDKILSNYLPKSSFTGIRHIFVHGDIPLIEQIIKGFESEGYPVVLIHRNIVDDINDIPQPSSPAALPPSTLPEVVTPPTTAQATTPAQISSEPDFATIDKTPKNYEGAEIVENRELDRLQIKFNGIPSEDCRNELKKSGFRWAPYYKVWQRKLTPAAITDANNIVAKYYNTISLGKPTIKFEFEDNNELMNLFEPGVNGLTVNDKPAAIFNCSESELQTQGYQPTYKRLADYSSLIDFADGAKTLKGYGFDNATLDELLNACTKYKQVEKLAAHLKDADKLQSAFNVWHWLHTNIYYNYDTPGQEEIRTPARVWRDRYSGVDCDCLAVFTACLFLNMGYKPYFEIVAFNNSPTYSHIYVNLDGYAIDRVLPVFLARPSGITKTKFMAIPVYELSGIGKCSTLQGVYDSTLYKMQQGNATTDEINDFRKTQILLTLKGIDEDLYKVAALLMPHVVTISDDGKYYFDSKKAAEVAKKADAQLSLMKQQNLSDIQKKYLMREIIDELDGITATSNDNDTIVIIINPKGVSTPIMANMIESNLPNLEVKPDATDNAENTVLQVYQTTAAPAQYSTYKKL